jgi:hypothetical protein
MGPVCRTDLAGSRFLVTVEVGLAGSVERRAPSSQRRGSSLGSPGMGRSFP